MAQKAYRLGHLPLGDEGADIGGGDRDALQLHLGHDVAAQAQPTAQRLKPLWVALSLVAKMIVVTGHQSGGGVALYQVFGDELPPGHGHHGLVIVAHNDVLDSILPAHQSRPVRGGGEQGGGRAGDEAGGAGGRGDQCL